MARTGRPCKLKDFSASFLKYIENGLPISSAAALSGLAPSTVMDWLAKGRAAKNKQFSDFLEQYTRARGIALGKVVARLTRASEEDWRALAWLAERMWPEELCLKSNSHIVNVVQHAGNGHGSMIAGGPAVQMVSEAELLKMAQIAAEVADQAPGFRSGGHGLGNGNGNR
jgi:hypothetical protein